MRALIAFDKFKDALSALEACEAAQTELQACRPDCVADLCPLTDGGEGFVEVLTTAANGEITSVHVTDPRGQPIAADIGFVDAHTIPPAARALLDLPAQEPGGARIAIIEMASASGLALLAPEFRDPWQTSSAGTGQLVRIARDAGASAILLGIGGSATNDLGSGALAELGLGFVDDLGTMVSPMVPSEWNRVTKICGSVGKIPPIRIACDVSNPLTGPNGATSVYGPQKGLRTADIPRMETDVCRMAALLQHHCRPGNDFSTMPGAGAAGGIAFGFATCLGARLISGFDLVTAWCELDAKLQAADIVITGEGCFDATSLQGKGPGAIAVRARSLGKAVHVFAGKIRAPSTDGISLHEISPAGLPLSEALRATRQNLAASIRTAFR